MDDNTPESNTETNVKVGHFDLMFYRHQQTVDVLEMPIDLIKEVIGSDLTIAVEGGQDYTLVPQDNATVEVMRIVYEVFKTMDEPTRFLYVLQQRCDALTKAVEEMFGKTKYKRIDTKEEVAELIAFHRGRSRNHNPRIVERPRIGAMYDRVVHNKPEEESE